MRLRLEKNIFGNICDILNACKCCKYNCGTLSFFSRQNFIRLKLDSQISVHQVSANFHIKKKDRSFSFICKFDTALTPH